MIKCRMHAISTLPYRAIHMVVSQQTRWMEGAFSRWLLQVVGIKSRKMALAVCEILLLASGKAVKALVCIQIDWLVISWSLDIQSMHLLFRIGGVWAVLRRCITMDRKHTMPEFAERSRQSNWCFLSVWPDVFVFKLALLIAWCRFRVLHVWPYT